MTSPMTKKVKKTMKQTTKQTNMEKKQRNMEKIQTTATATTVVTETATATASALGMETRKTSGRQKKVKVSELPSELVRNAGFSAVIDVSTPDVVEDMVGAMMESVSVQALVQRRAQAEAVEAKVEEKVREEVNRRWSSAVWGVSYRNRVVAVMADVARELLSEKTVAVVRRRAELVNGVDYFRVYINKSMPFFKVVQKRYEGKRRGVVVLVTLSGIWKCLMVDRGRNGRVFRLFLASRFIDEALDLGIEENRTVRNERAMLERGDREAVVLSKAKKEFIELMKKVRALLYLTTDKCCGLVGE